MTNLKVIESELVPVYETDKGEKVVYGMELYGILKPKSRYREWVRRRLEDVDAIEGEDYQDAEISASSGQTKKEHIIKLDIAKEMAMLERNSKGKQVRRYFIQVEKKYKVVTQGMCQNEQMLLGIFQEFTAKQEAFNHNITAKIESIDRHLLMEHNKDFSCMEKGLDISERKKYLYRLVEENVELRGISVNSFLHVMYSEIEREFDVTLNSYKSVYCSETRKPGAGMIEVIAANDRFYKLAVSLSKFMIKDYKEQAALADRMQEFNN